MCELHEGCRSVHSGTSAHRLDDTILHGWLLLSKRRSVSTRRYDAICQSTAILNVCSADLCWFLSANSDQLCYLQTTK
jgi:hypothetical protein